MILKIYVQRAGEKTFIGEYGLAFPPRVGERIEITDRQEQHLGIVLDVKHVFAPPITECHVTITQQVTE